MPPGVGMAMPTPPNPIMSRVSEGRKEEIPIALTTVHTATACANQVAKRVEDRQGRVAEISEQLQAVGKAMYLLHHCAPETL